MRIINLFLAVALLCCDYPKSKWPKTSDLDNPLLSSIFVSATVDLSVPYCPFYGTYCRNSYNEKLAYPNISIGTNPTCCEQCDSDHSAMRCCSEIMPCEDDVTNTQGKDRVCIRTVSELYDIGVLAVATCPNKSSDEYHRKCVQRYTTSNRYKATGGSYIVEAYDAMPARDFTTGTLYRNVYCALCNGIDVANIIFWELSVGCRFTSNLNLATDANILNIIKGTEDCYFVFKDPDTDVTSETCSTAVAKCNVTGKWGTWPYAPGPMEELRCLTGEPSAVISNGVLYKNGDCLLCNTPFMFGEPHVPFNNPSFSLLLKFGSTDRMSSPNPSNCGGGMVFHRSKGLCVEARCSLLRQLRGNVCERTMPNPDSFVYRICFRIVPQRAAVNVHTGYQFIRELGKQLKKLLLSVFPPTELIVYEMILVADREHTETFNVTELLEADLAFYIVQLKVVYSGSHDPEQTVKELIDLEDKVTLDIVLGQYNIGFKFRLLDGLFHFRRGTNRHERCSYTFIRFGFCEDVFDHLIKSKTYPIENLTAVPVSGGGHSDVKDVFFQTPVSTERSILELRNCPFVKETRGNMNWVETEIGIEFCISQPCLTTTSENGYVESPDRQMISLKASEYVYGENSNEIWMCLGEHEKLISSLATSFADQPRANLILNIIAVSFFVCVWYNYYLLSTQLWSREDGLTHSALDIHGKI